MRAPFLLITIFYSTHQQELTRPLEKSSRNLLTWQAFCLEMFYLFGSWNIHDPEVLGALEEHHSQIKTQRNPSRESELGISSSIAARI